LPLLACVLAATGLGGASRLARATEPPDARITWAPVGGGMGLESSVSAPALEVGPLALRVLLMSRARGATGDRLRASQILAGERIEAGGAARGGWLGVEQERYWGDALGSSFPIVTAGAWAKLHGFTVTTDVQRRTARIPRPSIWIYSWPPTLQGLPGDWPPSFTPWSNTLPFWLRQAPEQFHVTLVMTTVHWGQGPVQLAAAGGMVAGLGTGPYRLLRGEAAWWFRPNVAVSAAASGASPAWLGAELVEHPHFQLGLRVEPGRAAQSELAGTAAGGLEKWEWRTRQPGGGLCAFALWAPEARSVELRGDVTGWSLVPLEAVGSGWWETSLPTTPGVHEVEIRVDGRRWQPPPGVPAAVGQYGDRVGVIITE
jgi:hypothetical protein